MARRGHATNLTLVLEGPLERRIATDPVWREGASWGTPRPGHPEGSVLRHIAQVLANVAKLELPAGDVAQLRLVALVHDTLKFRVDPTRALVPPNEHGYLARRWAERHIDDRLVLDTVELHGEVFRAWRADAQGDPNQSALRVSRLVERMEQDLPFLVAFAWADSATGDKVAGRIEWLVEYLARWGVQVHAPPVR